MIPVSIDFEGRQFGFKLNDHSEWMKGSAPGSIYEPEVVNAMLRFVKPGDVVVDAGANLGYFSLLLSQLVGPTGKVHAFEPDTDVLPELMRNLDMNGASNVVVHGEVLAADEHNADFWIVPWCGYSSRVHYTNIESKHVVLPARPLDSYELPRPRLIKIDVEGSEWDVLLGANNLLRGGVDAVIVEFNFSLLKTFPEFNEKTIRDYMKDLGYSFYYLNGDGSPPQYVPPDLRVVGPTSGHHFNGLFSTPAKVAAAWGLPAPFKNRTEWLEARNEWIKDRR